MVYRMKIIIYGSKYGTAKSYALELVKRTNIDVKHYKQIKRINNYESIIYIGALYAGGVLGMKKTFKKLTNFSSKRTNCIYRSSGKL